MSVDTTGSNNEPIESFDAGVRPTPSPSPPSTVKLSKNHYDANCYLRSPHLWCLIETLRGDPILCLWATESLCLVGTLLGRSVAYTFNPPLEQSHSIRTSNSSSLKVPSFTSLTCFPSFRRSSSLPVVHVRPETSSHLFPLAKKQNTSSFPLCGTRVRDGIKENHVTPPGSVHLVAAYSDEGIRAVSKEVRVNKNFDVW